MKHDMKLNAVPYEKIKDGRKTIELRLNDEKRQKINVGDTLFFGHTEEEAFLVCTVNALYHAPSFAELFECVDGKKCGYEGKAEPDSMRAYYTQEQEEKYGVLGIAVEDVTEVRFERVEDIPTLSKLATRILKEYYDPIIGAEQNDYMLAKFQSVEGMKEQVAHGYNYYFVDVNGEHKGLFGFYGRGDELYLSKFYFDKSIRGKGYGNKVVAFLQKEGKRLGKKKITLNVNKYNPTIQVYEKMGFVRLYAEVNDIGSGFVMDDYVYGMNIE